MRDTNPGKPKKKCFPFSLLDSSWEVRLKRREEPTAAAKKPASQHSDRVNDEVYALPRELVELINSEVPRFFGEQDLEYEHRLARLAGGGYSLGRPFTCPGLPIPVADETAVTIRASDERVREMREDDMLEQGATREQIQAYWDREAKMAERIRAMQEGYLGWLITTPEFVHERNQICNKWRTMIEAQCCFPRVPMSFFGDASRIEPEYRDMFNAWQTFHQRWSIDGLLTWRLPLPMRPQFEKPSLYFPPSIGGSGITVFAPWWMLRSKEFTIAELFEHREEVGLPRHLSDWFAHSRKWGPTRFAIMFKLYVFLELALKTRYAGKVRGNLVRLDAAFATYIYDGEQKHEPQSESIRKIRLEMGRRLKACDSTD